MVKEPTGVSAVELGLAAAVAARDAGGSPVYIAMLSARAVARAKQRGGDPVGAVSAAAAQAARAAGGSMAESIRAAADLRAISSNGG